MKQLLKVALVLLAALTLTLTSCRPPELETAVMEYNKKRYETAKEHALEATEKYPENAEGWWIYGSSTMEIAKNYDDYVDGNAALDKAKKLNNNEYGKKVDDYKYHQYGTNFNKCVSYYNQAAKLSESDTLKAVVNKSIEKGMIAAIFNPTKSGIYSIIARAYTLLQDTVNTLKYYEKAYEVAPDSISIAFDLGYFYYSKKQDYAKTIKYLEPVVNSTRTDDNTIAYKKDGYVLLVQAYELSDQGEKGKAILIDAVEFNQDEPGLPFTLAMKYYRDQNWSEASKYFSLSIERGMEDPDPYLFAGSCKNLDKDYEGARILLEEGTEKFPDNGQIWNELAKSYAQLAMKKEAKNAFEKAKKLGVE